MSEQQQLEQAIAALEAQRAILGDAVVDTARQPLHDKLALLRAQPVAQQRKLVTILFADISGFTALSEHLDPEEVSELFNALWQRLDRAILDQGGTIDKHIGDALMALWGAAISREDDPEQAIRAALALQAKLATFRSEMGGLASNLHLRIGINTGMALLGAVGTTGEFTAMGDAVNLASRLEHAAPLDGILISHHTYRHVRGIFDLQALEPMSIRGKREQVPVYIVQRAKPRAFRQLRRGVEGIETALIGREGEIATLKNAFETVLEDGDLQWVTVVGEAGLGKSRLLVEFETWLDLDRRPLGIFKGRADPNTTGRPYHLLRDVLDFHWDILDSDPASLAREKLEAGVSAFLPNDPDREEKAHFIGHLLGFDFSESPHLRGVREDRAQVTGLRQRALAYLGQMFRAMVRDRPGVLLLEDIHWADDSSLDALDQLARELRRNPLAHGREQGTAWLVVGLARDTLYERRPKWGEGLSYHSRLELRPLDRHNTRRLVAEILRKVEQVPPELRDTVANTAEGNPFYVEELIRMLIEAGVIETGAEVWRVQPERLGKVKVPATLTGVLQARLEGLPTVEHETLKRASVIGQIFWDAAVERLGQDVQTTEATLGALRGREMVYGREASQFAPAREYTFKHVILRDVTYEQVLLRERRPLHAKAAAWLEERSGERADEFAGLIAGHYLLAEDGAQAAKWLVRAAKRAQESFANPTAANYFRQALDLIKEGTEERLEVLLRLGELMRHIAKITEAEAHLHQALALAERLSARAALAQAQFGLGQVALWHGDLTASLAWVERAKGTYESLGDSAGLSRALTGMSILFRNQGRLVEMQQAAEAALAAAYAGGDKASMANAFRALGQAAYFRDDYSAAKVWLEQALVQFRELEDKLGIDRMLNGLGVVAFAEKDYATAQVRFEEVLALTKQIGYTNHWPVPLNNLGNAAYMLGHYDQARMRYAESLALMQEQGEKKVIAMSLGGIAAVVAALGDLPRAARLSGAAQGLLDTIRATLEPDDRLVFEAGVSAARAGLTPTAFQTAWDGGRALPLKEAITKALAAANPGR